MIKADKAIYLASKSPRRLKLLKQLNLDVRVLRVDAEEKFFDKEKPSHAVKRVACDKMKAAREIQKEGVILTADTIVVLKGQVLQKPEDEEDAERILQLLNGNTHKVFTGFCVYNADTGAEIVDHEKTLVTFRSLQRQEVKDYIATGSPMDKAGAYGIQDDFGAVFVKKINGCYYNVVGLPLAKVYHALEAVMIDCLKR